MLLVKSQKFCIRPKSVFEDSKAFWNVPSRIKWYTISDVSKDPSVFIFSPRGVLLDWLTLNINALRFFETSLDIYQSTRRNIPEDLNLERHRCENLKSRTQWHYLHTLLTKKKRRTLQCRFVKLYWVLFDKICHGPLTLVKHLRTDVHAGRHTNWWKSRRMGN